MPSILVIVFKIMQQVNGFVNLSLLTRFQFVVALAGTVSSVSLFHRVLENDLIFAHIAINVNIRPFFSIVVMLVLIFEGDFLKSLLCIKPTIMRAISSFPRNVAFLRIVCLQCPRTNGTGFTHALSPLPKTIVVSPKSVFKGISVLAEAYFLFLPESSVLTQPLAVKTRIVEETELGEQPFLNQSLK